jgi:hypothetical protein
MKPIVSGQKYWKAGLIAGLVAAFLNIFIYLIMITIGGHYWDLMTAGSILVASLLPNLLAALFYFVLSYLTRRARTLLTIVVIMFVVISVLPHLGIGPAPSPALSALPEGFVLLTVPLHIVFGLAAIFIMPWLVAKKTD